MGKELTLVSVKMEISEWVNWVFFILNMVCIRVIAYVPVIFIFPSLWHAFSI